MKFSLLICTFKRPAALLRLLHSVEEQQLYPTEILIIDGSPDEETRLMLEDNPFLKLKYYKVSEQDRGLTRQRNFGIQRLSNKCEIVFFLDDDTQLEPLYFQEILRTYREIPDAVGVSGFITNEIRWKKNVDIQKTADGDFVFDGWVRYEGSRFRLRRKFGLAPNKPPGFMPDFSHGYSTAFLPPTGTTYQVEYFMGCSMSFRRNVVANIMFSEFFQGYGLYEDMDYCLRANQFGKLYVNTCAKLEHHHDPGGRPDMFKYGKMVLRNGWHVWRLKYPSPSPLAKIKWHSTSLLLIGVRIGNILTSPGRKETFLEVVGRFVGWGRVILQKK